MKKEMGIIEQKLQDCDVETIWRFNYLDDQCCACEDDQLEVGRKIEETKVEIEVLKRMDEDENDMEIKNLEEELDDLFVEKDRLYEREDILEDLWEEMLIEILKD